MSHDDLPVLTFPNGVPGLGGADRFALVSLDEAGLVYSLRSVDEPALRLLVVPPGPYVPDYAPEIDDDAVALLGLESAEDALLLLVLTPGETAATATVNLLAPIVVNLRTRVAAQVVLAGTDLPVRAPLAA